MSYLLPQNTQVGEVKLKVSNLERSLKFYEEVIGFQILTNDGKVAELAADGQRTLLVLEEAPDAVVLPPQTVSGLYHFAILVPTRKDLGISLRRLIESGIHIGQADHLVSEALYISDPDHNGIEIYRDRPKAAWKHDANGHVKMASDPIDWNGLLEEAKGSKWQGLPEGTTIGHVHFHVSDLQQSKQFYCNTMGFDMMLDGSRQMGALFIAAGGYHHHIGLNIWAGDGAPAPPANATGLVYSTLEFPNGSELDKLINHLKEMGVSARRQDQAWYIKDPSGIELRLISK